MSYCVDYNIIDVMIPDSQVDDCLKAINALGGIGIRFSWVLAESFPFPSLVKAFEEWRFSTKVVNGNVHLEYFTGEKLGDEETLFNTIDPFVAPGGIIEARGEDGEQWRFCFTKYGIRHQQARIVWE